MLTTAVPVMLISKSCLTSGTWNLESTTSYKKTSANRAEFTSFVPSFVPTASFFCLLAGWLAAGGISEVHNDSLRKSQSLACV
jgi:hypothetical protein